MFICLSNLEGSSFSLKVFFISSFLGPLVLPVMQLKFSCFSLYVSFLIHFFIFFILFLFH
ncbi:hypothetical protein GLOIN_2v1687746, partial [Rhizophagus irregularis DAOM 181602=DAOM 197198]